MKKELNRKILNILLGTLCSLVFMYVFFLGQLVFDIVERRALETEARTLASEVGALEVEYLSISDNIDLKFSYTLGFQEAFPKYATRKSLGSLGFLRNEI